MLGRVKHFQKRPGALNAARSVAHFRVHLTAHWQLSAQAQPEMRTRTLPLRHSWPHRRGRHRSMRPWARESFSKIVEPGRDWIARAPLHISQHVAMMDGRMIHTVTHPPVYGWGRVPYGWVTWPSAIDGGVHVWVGCRRATLSVYACGSARLVRVATASKKRLPTWPWALSGGMESEGLG